MISRRQSGPNYWLAKLYRALAGTDDFCDGGFELVDVPQLCNVDYWL
jgi:hypothetical protein